MEHFYLRHCWFFFLKQSTGNQDIVQLKRVLQIAGRRGDSTGNICDIFAVNRSLLSETIHIWTFPAWHTSRKTLAMQQPVLSQKFEPFSNIIHAGFFLQQPGNLVFCDMMVRCHTSKQYFIECLECLTNTVD